MDPITAAIALQLGSVYLKSRAASDERERRSRYLSEEMGRQQRYGAQSRAAVMDRLGRMTAADEAISRDAYVDRSEQMFAPTVGADNTFTGVGQNPTGSGESRSEIARQIHNALTAGKEEARRSARLRSYGVVGADRGMDISKTAGEVARINDFARGSLNVLPYEFDYATQSVLPTRQASDLAGTIGNALLMYGATRSPKPASGQYVNRGPANFGRGGQAADPNLWRISDDFAG